MSTLQAVKVSPLIERVSDHKDFKKLLRTRTNVLVLYTKSGECQTYVLEYNAVSMAVFKHIYASSSLVSLTIMTSMAFRGSVCIAFLHFSISAKYTSSSVSHRKCSSRVLYLRRGGSLKTTAYSSATIRTTLCKALYHLHSLVEGCTVPCVMCGFLLHKQPQSTCRRRVSQDLAAPDILVS